MNVNSKVSDNDTFQSSMLFGEKKKFNSGDNLTFRSNDDFYPNFSGPPNAKDCESIP